MGLARSLRDRFRQLPDAVHDRYRRQYDGAAAEAVQRAIEKNSPADVFLTENSPAMVRIAGAGLLAPVDQARNFRQVRQVAIHVRFVAR